MPWPTYSERFFHHQAAGYWYWTVPDGMRAIVQCYTAVNETRQDTYTWLKIGPIEAAFMFLPVAVYTKTENMRQVAYQGEELTLHIGYQGTHVTISGYLLADTSGNTGPPGQTRYERGAIAAPLPTAVPM